MDRLRIRRIVNIFIVVAVAGSWLATFLFGKGTLSENGLGSLKYFTVLSNIFEGIASAVWLAGTGKKAAKSENVTAKNVNTDGCSRIELLKYIAAASVGLTCATVLFFLGPLYGYPAMFAGANLFMHLITPVIAVAEILFLSDCTYSRKDNRLASLPPLLYGIVYLANIMVNGVGEWPDTNDWYLFLTWGYPVGILIFACICEVTWSIGFLMRKFKHK